jgi:hypothetical protein
MANEEKTRHEPSEFVEHLRAAGKAAGNQWKSLIPDSFWEHGRTARRETLLALRSLVDAAIERLEDKGETPRTSSRRKVKVEVE